MLTKALETRPLHASFIMTIARPNALFGTCLAMAAAVLLLAPPATAETAQQRWVGDLPIMSGMNIEPELGFAFDSPGGRIVLVFAAAEDSANDILAYYDSALASLGWQGGGGSWNRGGESLTLAQVDTSVGRLWRIRLVPN